MATIEHWTKPFVELTQGMTISSAIFAMIDPLVHWFDAHSAAIGAILGIISILINTFFRWLNHRAYVKLLKAKYYKIYR